MHLNLRCFNYLSFQFASCGALKKSSRLKTLHAIPKAQHATALCVNLHKTTADYVKEIPIYVDCLEASTSRVLIYNNLAKENFSLDEFLLTQEFKNALASSLFHHDLRLINHYAICHSPAIPFGDSVSFLNNRSVMLSDGRSDQKDHSEARSNEGRPSEEQLLIVTDHLSESISSFFRVSHDFKLYRKDVVFQNNILGFSTRGINPYIQLMYAFKLCGHLYYSRARVDVLKVTRHCEDGTVRVRWRVNGIARTKVISSMWKASRKTKGGGGGSEKDREGGGGGKEVTEEWLDGFSVFSVDKEGLIYKHVCDKMIPDDEERAAKPSSLRMRLLTLLGLAGRPSTIGGFHAMLACPPLRGDKFSGNH